MSTIDNPPQVEALRALVTALDSGLPAPMSVHLYRYRVGGCELSLRLPDDAPSGVQEWATHLGVTAFYGAVIDARTDEPWRSYRTVGRGTSTLAGWPVSVWSAVSLACQPPDLPADVPPERRAS